MKRNLIILSLVLIVLAAVFAYPDKAQAGILQVTQNTANESIAFYPEMDDNGRVAWVQTDAQGSKNLYLNDGQQIKKLNTTTDSISNISMGNGKIVWIQRNYTTGISKVYFHDGQQVQQLTSTTDSLGAVSAENGKIAWCQINYSTMDRKLFFYDGQQILELYSGRSSANPVLNNGQVAWAQSDTLTGNKICYYNGQQVLELFSTSDSIGPVAMENGKIAWIQYKSMTGFKICLYDGQQVQELYSTTDTISTLTMRNGEIAWIQNILSAGPYDFKLCLYDGQQIRELTSTTDYISTIIINNNQVAWTQFDSTAQFYSICLYDGQAVQKLVILPSAGAAGFYKGELVLRIGTYPSGSALCLWKGQKSLSLVPPGDGNPGYLKVADNRILFRSSYYNELFLYSTTDAEIQALSAFVTRFYTLCINRQPDEEGLEYWVNELATGQKTGALIGSNFIFSAEFIARNLSDSDFLDIMYNTFFNRTADSGGKAYWQSQLDTGMSRWFVLSSFVNSPEFTTVCNDYGIIRGNITLTYPSDLHPQIRAFVNRFYVLCMDREPDFDGLNYWVDQLASGQQTGAQLAQGFVFSPEFTAKNLDDTGFITVMYRVFFDREPDSGGQTYWVSHLDSGTSRLQVLAGFVSSPEFAALCSSIGIPVGAVQF